MKLLLAIDASPYSEAPVLAVTSRPWPAGTTVRVISVVEVQRSPGVATAELLAPESYAQGHSAVQREAEALVQNAVARVQAAGLSAEGVVCEGKTGDEIVEQARAWGADLILIGSRGRTGLKRMLMGSVAQHVVEHARCSVEVARAPIEGAT